MNKQDLDALSNLYEEVHCPQNVEQLNEYAGGGNTGPTAQDLINRRNSGPYQSRFARPRNANTVTTVRNSSIRPQIASLPSSARQAPAGGGLGAGSVRPAAAPPKPAAVPPKPAGGGSLTRPRTFGAVSQNPVTSSLTVKPGTKAAGPESIKPKTPNPLMKDNKIADMIAASKARQAGQNVTSADIASKRSSAALQTASKGLSGSGALKSSYEWPSTKTIRDIADAYASIYEAKKKDQDKDGDNDFADVRIARMIASGMSKAEAIAAVKNKEYNEEFELDEATRMRKELGKEGETAVRKELAARSKAYKRSGSVDKTIAAAERGADRPYIKHKRDESDSDRKKREERQSRTLRGLAASRRGSVRDRPRVELRGYAAKVEGSDKDLQSARQRAMSAGTLTPKEKKQLGEVYEIVASYLLENNFAATINDANVIIENMSEVWLGQILESAE